MRQGGCFTCLRFFLGPKAISHIAVQSIGFAQEIFGHAKVFGSVGKGVAAALVASGANVMLMGRTADRLAAAADEIRAIDRKAQIVSASSTVIQGKKFASESFFYRYLRSIAKRKVKLDAISVHLYPWTTKGPGGGTPSERLAGLEMARTVVNKVGLSKVPIWDTEVNYGDRRAGLPQVVPEPQTAATYVARTYLDSATLGIARTYWYGWDLHVLGIDHTTDAGVTPAGTAFLTVRDWLTGARPEDAPAYFGGRGIHVGSPWAARAIEKNVVSES